MSYLTLILDSEIGSKKKNRKIEMREEENRIKLSPTSMILIWSLLEQT